MSIAKRINEVKSHLSKECRLVAVSKFQPIHLLQEAYDCGQRIFGESKVQELVEKEAALPKDIEWHFIGHLQTNKVKYIIDKVYLIQSLDSISLAGEIDKQAKKHNKVMDVLVEVNICAEESKSDVLPENLENFLKEISSFPNIRVLGLMSIPPIMNDVDTQREIFRKIMKIYVDISQKKLDNINMQILSMGMSDDYEIAVEEGSTMVRVGSSLFGKRNYNK